MNPPLANDQVLERLAFEDADSEDGEDSEEPGGRESPSVEHRLLLVLSNCHVLRVSRAPELDRVFTSHGSVVEPALILTAEGNGPLK